MTKHEVSIRLDKTASLNAFANANAPNLLFEFKLFLCPCSLTKDTC